MCPAHLLNHVYDNCTFSSLDFKCSNMATLTLAVDCITDNQMKKRKDGKQRRDRDCKCEHIQEHTTLTNKQA